MCRIIRAMANGRRVRVDRMSLVVYTERDDETVRIVSARWATKRETDLYRNHIRGRAR
jgi:uncharacterized DUF497 family protein